ncbi:MAG TPA: 5-formyltetrahydrofolate cyclo-ligase [Pyrinomonadaceae bacterium]|nr:5-formyltetrahydrofolate cyclo-ligase [Pyrinomonadaceae bacterium]
MKKSELRRIFLDERKAMSPELVKANSRSISDNFFEQFDLSNIQVLHIYLSIEKFHEVNTSFLIGDIWYRFPEISLVVPRIDRESGEIESVVYKPETKLIENGWGIREPSGEELADPSTIDFVIVPLLCFDLFGNRVGYGKGFYDRFLSRCRPDCVKVGLCVFQPVEGIDDLHEGDVALNACVTPGKIFRFQPVSRLIN